MSTSRSGFEGLRSGSSRSWWKGARSEELESRVLLSGYGAMYDGPPPEEDVSAEFVLEQKWNQPGGTGSAITLTWSYSNLLNGGMSGISAGALRAGTIEALQVWSAVAPLRFHQINDLGTNLPPSDGSDPQYSEGSHARLRFGHHGGFGSTTLAHGYYPRYVTSTTPTGLAGDTHFNSNRTWATSPGSGVLDYIEVATHEVGHNLGLNHEPSSGNNAIMNPNYGARFSGPGTAFLLQDDINGIQAHYGSGLGYVLDTNGRMYISGTEGNNSITLRYNSSTQNIFVSSSGFGSFTRAISGINSIEVNGRGGGDTFWIDNIPSNVPVTVNGGAGNDSVRVGWDLSDSSQNLDNVDSAITFIGGAGDDSIVLYDQDNTFSDTFTITSNNINRVAFGGITYSSVASVTINGGSGGSSWNVNSTSSAATYQISAGDGNDTLNLAQASSNLTNLQGHVNFNGQGGDNNRIFLQDSNQTINRTIGITSGSVTRNVFGGLGYSNTHELTYNGGGGVNTFTVSGTHANTPVFINAGAGNDVLNVGTGNLNNLNSRVTFSGQSGTDTITVNDSSGSTARSYTVTSTQVNRTDFGGLTYGSSEGLTLNAAGGNDSVSVTSTLATTPVTVNGGAGNDSLTLSSFLFLPPFIDFRGDLNNLAGAVTFNGGTGTDSITLHDADGTTGRTYALTSNSVNRSSFGGVTHSSVEGVTLNAAGGNDTFNVNSTSSATPLTLNGNAGNDQFRINAPPLATINVNGGAPPDGSGDGLLVLGASGATGMYMPSAATPGNGVVVVNGRNINFTSIETPFGGVQVENFDTFRVVTPNSQDDIQVGSLAAEGLNIISGSSDGVAFPRLLFRDVTNFILDTGANDGVGGGSASDSVRVAPLGLVAAGLGWFRYIGGVGNDTLTVDHGTFTFLNDPSDDTANLRVNVNTDDSSTATVEFTAPVSRIDVLQLGTGGNVVLPTGSQKVLVTDNIFNSTMGKIDLTTNGLIVAPAGGVGSLDPAHSSLASGYNGGGWNGNGVMSSSAAADSTRAVGMALTGEVGISTFMGVPVSNSTLVLRYTYAGDANLDEQVNIADLGILAANWQQDPRYWHQGNFNYDLQVNIADLGILAANWQAGASFSDTSIAEDEEEDAEAIVETIVDDPAVRDEIKQRRQGGPNARAVAASQGRAGGRRG